MDIKAWLTNQNRSYKDGLAIYQNIKRNNKKDAFFSSINDASPHSLHMNLLLQEIQTALRISLANTTTQTPIKPPPGKPITTRKLTLEKRTTPVTHKNDNSKYVYNEIVDVKSLPENLQKLYFRNQEITRKLSGLHQQLKIATTDQTRALAAGQIDALFVERKSNWQQIDSLASDKPTQTPTAKIEPDTSNQTPQTASNKQLAKDMLEAQRRLKTVKINVSRVEKELSNTSLQPSKVKSKKSRLKIWKSEMDDLQKQLELLEE